MSWLPFRVSGVGLDDGLGLADGLGLVTGLGEADVGTDPGDEAGDVGTVAVGGITAHPVSTRVLTRPIRAKRGPTKTNQKPNRARRN